MAQQKVAYLSNHSIGLASSCNLILFGIECRRNIFDNVIWLENGYCIKELSDSEAKIISDGFAKIQKMIDLQTATIKAIIERK